MAEPKSKLERLEAAAKVVPQYPGRAALEKAVTPAVRVLVNRASTAQVMRLLGYWQVWSVTPGGRAEIVDRGWMGRRQAFQTEADFRSVFGCRVADFDPAKLPELLLGSDEDEAPAT